MKPEKEDKRVFLRASSLACVMGLLLVLGGCASTSKEGASAMKYVESADKAYNVGDWRSAEIGYRRVISALPNDAYAYFRLGNTLIQQGRLDESIQAYEHAISVEPGLAKAYNNIVTAYLIKSQKMLEYLDERVRPNDDQAHDAIDHRMFLIKEAINTPIQDMRSITSR